MVSFARTQGLPSDSFPSTFTFLSSTLSEIKALLETPYVGRVYFPTPLTVLHLGKEEEGNTATSFGPPPSTKAS